MVPKRETPLPNDSPPKVTELRNEKEITRAIKYTEEELETHLQLGTADTESKALILQSLVKVVKNIGLGQTGSELSSGIDELLETIGNLDQAALDLVAGAEAQAAELAAELEKLPKRKESGQAVTLAEITDELIRRGEERIKITSIQERLENERDEMAEQIKILENLLTHEASEDPKLTKMKKDQLGRKLLGLDGTISAIVVAVAENDNEVDLLTSYSNAIKLVENGLPSGIMGKNFDFRK